MNLNELFKIILSLSLMGSILAVIILIIKKLFIHKFNSHWHYYIWVLLIIRLVVPFTPESPISIFNLFPTTVYTFNVPQEGIITDIRNPQINTEARNLNSGEKDVNLQDNQGDTIGTDSVIIGGYRQINPDPKGKMGWHDSFGILWVMGVIAMLSWNLVVNSLFSYMLKRQPIFHNEDIIAIFIECKNRMSIKKDISIINSDKIYTPSLFGLFKPKLLVSFGILDNLSENEIKHIFYHELAHLKKKDILINWVMVLIQSIHWFNPMVWYSFKRMRQDGEVSCDAYVLSMLEPIEHKKYGNTIIKLLDTTTKSLLSPITTGAANNKSDIKRRITKIAVFKKSPYRWSIIALVVVAIIVLVGLTDAMGDKNQFSNIGKTDGKVPLIDSDSVKLLDEVLQIELVGYNRPILINDDKIIKDLLEMMNESKIVTDVSKFSSLSGMAKRNQMTLTNSEGKSQNIWWLHDSLPTEIGYIEIALQKFEPDYSFFRYMESLIDFHENINSSIDEKVMSLFKDYNWTVDYKLNTVFETLPENLKHKAGEFPYKIYWAYNNELSKGIGLDYSIYLGQKIEVEIYKLREPLPDYLYPRRNARGIVMKENGNIIGAYIDAGRHNSFACSLDRKNLEDITNMDWDQWIAGYIEYTDELELQLSKLEPEELIRTYFDAINRKDESVLLAVLSRRSLIGYMTVNINIDQLYNIERDKSYTENIKSVELLEITENKGSHPEVLQYQVLVDYSFEEVTMQENGLATRFITLGRESEKLGWRIESIGTGP